RLAVAQGPFVYFAGNPANAWYVVGGACPPSGSLTLSATYIYFVSGDLYNASNPPGDTARWTAFPFQLCAPITFDSIVYAPRLALGFPEVRIWITGARTGADGRLEPNLNNILFFRNVGLYPGDPPAPGEQDERILTYYGGTTDFLYIRTTPLGQSVTLQPGTYFAIIVGDEDFATAGLFQSYIALCTGAPGGPKLYYTPRGLGGQNVGGIFVPSTWQRFRYNPASPAWPCERVLNSGLPFRADDPFANIPPWSGLPEWHRYHSPYLYHGVLGFRNSQAASGRVTGTAVTADVGSPSPPTNVEVIFYRPGTKQRVARFSGPTAAGPNFPIESLDVEAGVYDIVVRPIYAPVILTTNCPTNLCVTNVTYSPDTHWLSVRLRNVNVSGVVDLGTITLPNGDTNGDLVVNNADLLNVLFDFGLQVSDNPAADKSDLNEDGVVNNADLLIILFNFGAQGEDGDESCN
ncbi:MAG: hypothetical protein RMK45_04215, partial [Armatimonadota bacterium]|nr:hypothetical protein [Armatimonadota bacterium]